MIGGPTARHSLVIVRAALVDDGRGNETRDWASPTRKTSPGWGVDIGNTLGDTQNRDGYSIAYTVRGPFNADVDGRDRVELFGDTYEITGGAQRQPGASALTSHTILLLVKWVG